MKQPKDDNIGKRQCCRLWFWQLGVFAVLVLPIKWRKLMFSGSVERGVSDPCEHITNTEPKSSKRQYTVKGIEDEVIGLMRSAAKVEGMKINSWISHRMKEAAEKALASVRDEPSMLHNNSEPASVETTNFKFFVCDLLEEQQHSRKMIERLQSEVHCLLKAQLDMAANISHLVRLSNRDVA